MFIVGLLLLPLRHWTKKSPPAAAVSAKPVCGHSHFSCATGKAGDIWAKWRTGVFLCVREPYAIQPALKHIPKDGKWQYKLGCLSPLQKFTPNRCPNRYLISAGTGGNLGWYFCYMNACSQGTNRHSQCTWLISYLTGTNETCFYLTGCPVPLCPALCSFLQTQLKAHTHTPVTRAQSSLSHSGMFSKN